MLKLKERFWILVGDGASARILPYAATPGEAVSEPIWIAHHDAPFSRELVSDRPGRSFDSKGHNRHAIAPRADAHEQEEQHFLQMVIAQLDKYLQEDRFDTCAVILPPRALAYFRQHVPKGLKKRISLELCKDLTKQTNLEVTAAVRHSFEHKSI